MATVHENQLNILKIANNKKQNIDCIKEILKKDHEIHKNAQIGIAHTRWATCGEVN